MKLISKNEDVGQSRKRLSDNPCIKKHRSLLDPQVAHIESYAEEQGLPREEALQVIVEECKSCWKIKSALTSVPIETCTSIVFNIGLSISQYQMLDYLPSLCQICHQK